MNTAVPRTGYRNGPRPRRWFLVGFLVGALLLVPVAMLALVLPAAESLVPFLTPATVLLLPFTGLMADWPGLLNLVLASLANGALFGLLAGLLALLLGRRRR